MLLTVPIMEGLTWNKVDPAEPDNPDCLPSLFLHFPDRKVDGQSKLIQIFSKQVNLSETIVVECVQSVGFSLQVCMMNALLISVVDAPADIGKGLN